MTDGVPGGDPEITENGTVGDGLEGVLIRWLVAFVKLVIYIAIPPLALYSDPFRGIWNWRKIYLVFLVGTGLVFLPSVLTGHFAPLALFPAFHLIIAALLAEVVIAMFAPGLPMLLPSIPSVSVPSSAPVLMPGLLAPLIVAAALLLVSIGLARTGVNIGLPSIFSRSDPDPEYEIPMTEVWKSGGKHD